MCPSCRRSLSEPIVVYLNILDEHLDSNASSNVLDGASDGNARSNVSTTTQSTISHNEQRFIIPLPWENAERGTRRVFVNVHPSQNEIEIRIVRTTRQTTERNNLGNNNTPSNTQ